MASSDGRSFVSFGGAAPELHNLVSRKGPDVKSTGTHISLMKDLTEYLSRFR